MKTLLQKFYRKITLILAIVIVTMAVIIVLTQAFTPVVASRQPNLTERISKIIRQPLVIEKIQPAWHDFEPVLRLQNVILLNKAKQPDLTIGAIDLGLDFGHSFLKWQFSPGIVVISNVHLNIVSKADGTTFIEGINALPPIHICGVKSHLQLESLNKLFGIDRLSMENISINWYRPNNQVVKIRNLQFRLQNSDKMHQFTGRFDISQNLPSHLAFNGTVLGDFSNLNKLTINANVKGKGVSLAEWLGNFSPDQIKIGHGIASFKARLLWKNMKLDNLDSSFFIKSLVLNQTNTRPFSLKSFSGNVSWLNGNLGGWNLAGDKIQIITPNETLPLINFYVKYPQVNANNQQSVIYLNYLHLQTFLPFFQNKLSFLPAKVQQLIVNLQPRGEIQNLLMQKNGNNTYSVAMTLRNIQIQSWKNIPAIDNLSGKVIFTPDEGKTVIQSQNLAIYFPNLFNDFQHFSKINATFTWKKLTDGWQINSGSFAAINSALSLIGDMTLTLPSSQKSPEINLLLGLNNFDLSHFSTYLPTKILSPKLSNWLLLGIKKGQIKQSILIIRGPLQSFPFDKNEGIFMSASQLKGVKLVYQPGWPPAVDLSGNLYFKGRQMYGNFTGGKIYNTQIKNLYAEIPTIGLKTIPPIVNIKTNLQGNLTQALSFLKTGPLKNKIGRNLKNLQSQGPMAVNLQLTVPLKNTKNNIKTSGIITTQNAILKVINWNLTLTALAGKLQFVQADLFARNLKALLFNQPVLLNLTTLHHQNEKTTQITMQGKTKISTIAQQFNLPMTQYIYGNSTYNAVLSIPHNPQINNTLCVTSNLVGTAIALPEPLAKSAKDSVNLTVQATFSEQNPLQLYINYENRLTSALQFTKKNNKLSFLNGDLRFGSGKAVFQTKPGLLVSGRLAEFNWQTWAPLINQFKNKSAGNASLPTLNLKPKFTLLRMLDMTFDRVIMNNIKLDCVHLQLVPQDRNWFVLLDSPQIAGQITIPYELAKDPITAYLTHLFLPELTSMQTIHFIQPQSIPQLEIYIDDFRYNRIDLGTMELSTNPIASGMQVNHLIFTSTNLYLAVKGNWINVPSNQSTNLMGILSSDNFGKILTAWQLPGVITAKNVKATFNLSWPNAPYSPNLAQLMGNVSLEAGIGVIKDIGKKASAALSFGKLLTLLSLENIPRRILQHFSDVAVKGFTFNSLKGDFIINHGIVTTENTVIKGVVADVEIQGTIGLATQDFALNLAVTPHITASLPVIGAIAAGPLTGVAIWVINKILSPAVNTIVKRHYTVTGSWHQPVIKQVYIRAASKLPGYF